MRKEDFNAPAEQHLAAARALIDSNQGKGTVDEWRDIALHFFAVLHQVAPELLRQAQYREATERQRLVGEKRLRQVVAWGKDGAECRRIYSAEDHKTWRNMADDLPANLSCNAKAIQIAKSQFLPNKAVQTIRKSLRKKLVNASDSPASCRSNGETPRYGATPCSNRRTTSRRGRYSR